MVEYNIKRYNHEAIQITLDGVEYRSKTEASWAAFLTVLEIQFMYEKPVAIRQKRRYGYVPDEIQVVHPDFWLPDYETWIEIKGSAGELLYDLEGIERFTDITTQTGFQLVLIHGSVRNTKFRVLVNDESDSVKSEQVSLMDIFGRTKQEITTAIKDAKHKLADTRPALRQIGRWVSGC